MIIRHSANRQPAMALIVLCVGLFASSCATRPPASEPTALPEVQTAVRPDGSVRGDTSDEAVARLWASAEEARRAGQAAVALELLYDALELDPQNALLWSRAAELQLDNLEAALAENYASKSNSFAGENNNLLYRNWLIIEHARNMRGDLLGVRSAHKKVQQYQYQ
ncbi:MAG: hypothetical protein HKN42_06180 [Granulosicoccus sp.]|nr:hypothetical protein [Granulosicoccus sp.]